MTSLCQTLGTFITLGVSTVEIEIENVLRVETNFFKLSRFSRGSRSTFFFFSVEIFKIEIFQSRLWRVEIFVEIVEICRDASRFSRFVETQSRFVETQSRFVEKSRHCRGLKFRQIEKSWRENTKIHALLGRDLDKLSRNAENFRSRRISRSRSRLTFWRCWDFLECRDSLFDDVEIESLDRDHFETNRDPQG